MNAIDASTLERFQDDFAHALLGEGEAWLAQPAFAVYRNTVMKGCIDALEANFPSVVRLVGRDWFRSTAALHVAAQPPSDGALLLYGRAFPQFLRSFPPAAHLSYLAKVAELDRFWTEAHAAADASPLNAAELASLSPDVLADCRLQPHPAARWAWFEHEPIYTIWSQNRLPDAATHQQDIEWHSEGALLTRPGEVVHWQAASAAECAFLDACVQGARLPQATERALQADPAVDLMAMLASLLQAGAFVTLNTENK